MEQGHSTATVCNALNYSAKPRTTMSLFHGAVAGADVVMGGGPHSLRGIEIYKGKPIFYGLGVFFINARIVLTQDELTSHYGPPPAVAPPASTATARRGGANPSSWYDGFGATNSCGDGVVSEVRLYPSILDSKEGRTAQGCRTLLRRSARKILEAASGFGSLWNPDSHRGLGRRTSTFTAYRWNGEVSLAVHESSCRSA
jgi:poly-gamma-glutamate synthesis protein (capsule biosynthesis protein)